MAAQEPVNETTHPESMLLPWYLNGTLSKSERRQVTTHLAQCADCQAELDELKVLRQQVQAVYKEQENASAQAFRATMANISQLTKQKHSENSYSESASWLHSLDNFLRSVLAPRWVPTVVSLVLLAQLGILLFNLRQMPSTEQVSTRSVAPPSSTLRVIFNENASERQIRSALEKVNGQMVNGPMPEGSYIIQIQTTDQTVIEGKIAILRQNNEIIRSVEQIRP